MAKENTANFGTKDEVEEIRLEKEALLAELDALKKKRPVYLQVSEKGAVSIYGIRRFPITLYKEEMNTVLGLEGEIRTFMAEHDSELAVPKSSK
ncbi:MAG: hypothetical protein ACWGQW_15590 [bacterium]